MERAPDASRETVVSRKLDGKGQLSIFFFQDKCKFHCCLTASQVINEEVLVTLEVATG